MDQKITQEVNVGWLLIYSYDVRRRNNVIKLLIMQFPWNALYFLLIITQAYC